MTPLYIAPSSSFESPFYYSEKVMQLPVLLKEGRTLYTFDTLPESIKLDTSLEGAVNKKMTGKVDFQIANFKPRNIGFFKALDNTPVICFIPDLEENIWVLGNHKNRAHLDISEATTGKRLEDFSGVNCSFVCKASAVFYPFDINDLLSQNVIKIGDYNEDYNSDFLI